MNGSIIIAWNNIYLDLVRKIGGAPGPLSRIGGLMHWAMYEAVNRLTPGTPYALDRFLKATDIKDPATGTVVMPGLAKAPEAAAYAACYTLTLLLDQYITKERQMQGGAVNPFDPFQVKTEAHTNALATLIPPAELPAAKAADAYGRAIAHAVCEAHPASAGFDMTPDKPFPGTTPGEWRPSGSGDALTPNWGKVPLLFKPAAATTYLPTVIPDAWNTYSTLLKSDEYARQLAEVQELGGVNSTTRTAEQTEIALFWANDLNGTYKPPGQLFNITQTVAQLPVWQPDRRVVSDLLETARLFAMVGAAMLNAGIVAWNAKYFWPGGTGAGASKLLRLWRPETAIRLASGDGNATTASNHSWQPLSPRLDGTRFSPNFPAFVSGHSTFGAAHAAAMRTFFGRDTIAFTATTEDPHAAKDAHGVRRTRQFQSFTQAALENGRSRIYLGVHYQFDADGGYEIGTAVGRDTAQLF